MSDPATPNVLVVDDSQGNRYFYSHVLRAAGFTVREAATAGEALEAVGDVPDIIVLDVKLPDVDGFTLARRLKSNPATASVPIIQVSAALPPLVTHKVVALENGADAYLNGAIEGSELVATVNALLRARRAERDLKASHALFRLLVDHTPALVTAVDRDGRIALFNPACEALTGYTRDEAVGQPLLALLVPEHARSEVVARLGSTADDLARPHVNPWRTRSGEERLIEWRCFHVPGDGGEPIVVGMGHDVTERKQAEDRVARSERLLRDIIDYSDAVVYLKDTTGRYITANRRYEELTCTRRDDLVGRTDYDVFPKEYADTYRANDLRVLEAGRAVHVEETALIDGVPRTFLEVKFPVRDASGEVYGICGIATDITERKRAEATLRQSEQALRDADRRKDEFLAMLAHELRNPLAVIMAGVAALDRAGSPAPAAVHLRTVVRRQSAKLARLLDDLLDVARIAEGKIELRRAPVDLREIAQIALDSERVRDGERARRVTAVLPAQPVVVDGDALRLQQIVGNLLTNAAKYTPADGAITVTVRHDGNDAVLEVQDTGQGIPPDRLHAIFELFTQLDGGLARSQGGLGVGLALVKRLVEMHGGSVEAHSEGVGRGSRFTVRVPLAAAPNASAPASTPAPADGVFRILVVEDNDDAREVLRVGLELEGQHVEVAADGAEGVALALASRPDVVLVDIGLPGLDGFEVARHLRAELGAGPFIVALTGYGQHEDRRRTSEAGFDAHLTKPATVEQILDLIRRERKTA